MFYKNSEKNSTDNYYNIITKNNPKSVVSEAYRLKSQSIIITL